VSCLLWKQEDCMSVRQTLPYILAATLACAVLTLNVVVAVALDVDVVNGRAARRRHFV
jgi:hypothetical protein